MRFIILLSSAQDTLDKPLKDVVTVGIRPEHLTPAHKDEAIVFGTVRLVEKFGEYDLVYSLFGPVRIIHLALRR